MQVAGDVCIVKKYSRDSVAYGGGGAVPIRARKLQ